jgi:hypothetical protein
VHGLVNPEQRQRELPAPERQPVDAPPPPAGLDPVLRAVNRIRIEHGVDPLYELPKGRPALDHGGSCVLEKAFADIGVCFVDYRYALGKGIKIEHGLGAFIRDFDAGNHPGLIG